MYPPLIALCSPGSRMKGADERWDEVGDDPADDDDEDDDEEGDRLRDRLMPLRREPPLLLPSSLSLFLFPRGAAGTGAAVGEPGAAGGGTGAAVREPSTIRLRESPAAAAAAAMAAAAAL